MNLSGLRRAAPLAAALGALTLLAAWPVLRAGYPTIGDGLNHYYRLVEFAHLLRQGVWFPRWAPDLAYGFGYPLFNYYPPLTYYLGAALHGLGLSLANSLVGVYVLAWALAVSGAYAAARARWGAAAGLLAGAAYGLSPYLYFNALARGALPETLGLGLLPWAVWAAGRLTVPWRLKPQQHMAKPAYAGWETGAQDSEADDTANRPGHRVLVVAGLFAALTLTHFLTAFVALPLLALAALWPADGGEAAGWRGRLGRAGLAVALGLGLSAYFLLPAVLETGAVQVHQLTSPGDLDFRNNFLTLGELLAWPQPFDPRLVFQAVPPSLSLAALAVAVVGLALTVWRARRLAWASVAWAGALVVYAALTLPAATPLWTLLPVAGIIQFPWRLVGPASLVLALLAGHAGRSLAIKIAATHGEARLRGLGQDGKGLAYLRYGVFVIVVVALYFFSLTWSFAPEFDAPARAGVGDLAQYEQRSGQLGTTSAGEFLPVAVQTLPAADALSALYAEAEVIPRLNTLPAGVVVTAQQATVSGVSAQLTADAPATLTFDLFAYPGWRATVDGQAAALTAAAGTGLITVEVPAGAHTVALGFGLTPLRMAAVAVSVVTALGMVVVTWRLKPRLHKAKPAYAGWERGGVETVVVVTAVALLVVRVAMIEGRATVFARSPFDGATVAGVAQPLDVNFDDQLVLIGQDPAALAMPADGTLNLTLYWRAQTTPAADYAATVQVWDADGNIWAQADSQHPGRLPTTRWRADQYARDLHPLSLPLGTPPGTYQVVVGVYPAGGAPLSVLAADRAPQGAYYALGRLTVARAATPPVWSGGLPVANVGALRLLALSAEPRVLWPGDDLTLVMLWQAPSPPPELTLSLGLLNAANEVVVEQTGPPSLGYPILDWRRNEIVRTVQHLRLPADAAPGTLTLAMRQFTVSTGAPIGPAVRLPDYTVSVQALARSFVVPPMAQAGPYDLGPAAQLLGYDLDAAAGTLTLYWQTRALLDVRYTVFVQALGPEGAVLAQADQPPAGGARPTTSWLPGEVITDAYTLPLAGAAQVSVGLYDPATRVRLGTVTIDLP